MVVYSSSSRFKKWVGSLALLVFVLTLVAALGGHFKPYSMADPAFPRPKRLFLVVCGLKCTGAARACMLLSWELYGTYLVICRLYSIVSVSTGFSISWLQIQTKKYFLFVCFFFSLSLFFLLLPTPAHRSQVPRHGRKHL